MNSLLRLLIRFDIIVPEHIRFSVYMDDQCQALSTYYGDFLTIAGNLRRLTKRPSW